MEGDSTSAPYASVQMQVGLIVHLNTVEPLTKDTPIEDTIQKDLYIKDKFLPQIIYFLMQFKPLKEGTAILGQLKAIHAGPMMSFT